MRISDWSSDVCSSDLGRSGVQILEPRVRDRDRGGAVRDPVFAHAGAARAGATVEPAMKRAIAVNGLLALLALATLVPLAWMVSVSLLAPGDAAPTPPPLLPDHARLATSPMLFPRLDMAHYFPTRP